MAGTSRKTRMVSFRMSVECYAKILKALETPTNGNSSVSDYCKKVIERYAFRHDKVNNSQNKEIKQVDERVSK